jgi:IS30 family transposase
MEQTANTGSFIREFVLEKISFVSISERDVALAIDQLDHRPRKCLGLITSVDSNRGLSLSDRF